MLGKTVCSTNTGAYCRARSKITWQAVRDICCQLAESAEAIFDHQNFDTDLEQHDVVADAQSVATSGFPRVSEIGSETADSFFLLLIHADRDREFQKRCVEQMKEMPDEWAQSYVDKLVLRRNLTANMNLKQNSDTTTEKPADKPTEKQSGMNPTNGQSNTEETPVDVGQP